MKSVNSFKLLYLTHYPIDNENPSGGVESVNTILVNKLSKMNEIQLYVLSFRSDIDRRIEQKLDNGAIIFIPKPKLPELILFSIWAKMMVYKEIMRLQPDIIHSHDTYGLLTKKNINIPEVFTVHGFIHKDTGNSKKNYSYLRAILWKFLETRMWKNKKHIISINPYVKQYVSQFTKAIFYNINNPVDDLYFKSKASSSSITIISVGNVARSKDTLLSVKIFKHLHERDNRLKLLIIGSLCDKNYHREINEYIVRTDLTRNVSFLGQIDKNTLQGFYSSSKLMIFTSLHENSPMVIAEAMAAGLPIVSVDITAVRYMVKDIGNGILFDRNKYIHIIGRITEILENSESWGELSSASNEVATLKYASGSIAKKHLDLYKNILISNLE